MKPTGTPTNILMVEDNRGDVVLMEEAIRAAGFDYRVTVVRDGVAALEYLRPQGPLTVALLPDLILLDLKLPRMSGREVLAELSADPALRDIPVAILSSSRSELELVRISGQLHCTSFAKPSTFAGCIKLLTAIDAFHQSTLRRPPGGTHETSPG